MKKRLLLVSGILFLTYSCGEAEDTTTEETQENTEEVSTENETEIVEEENIALDVESEVFKQYIDGEKGLILDVRTADEFNGGHIEGAVNIDFYGETFESSMDSLDPASTVLVYCQAGGRSGQAMEMLAGKGFKEVYNLVGGYGNWPYK
jgi:rhodanese-related sulfurtransferase